jgi:hypothetical protein
MDRLQSTVIQLYTHEFSNRSLDTAREPTARVFIGIFGELVVNLEA